MKIKLDYTVKGLFRANLIYILAFITLSVILLTSTFFFFRQYWENSLKINSLQSETNDLNKKKDIIKSTNQFITEEINLDDINLVLGQLIPSEDDYFSVAVALEKLSFQTNFFIVSYSIDISQSTGEKLAIVIEGQGDTDSFLSFLKTYKFGGGRVITINKIELVEQDTINAKISINVYRGKGRSAKSFEPLTEEDKRLVAEVLKKVQVDFKTEETASEFYPTKSNPF